MAKIPTSAPAVERRSSAAEPSYLGERAELERQRPPLGTEAIKFLQHLYPEGPWVLTAIVPDGATKTQTFTQSQLEPARKFIAEHNRNGENVYYSINPTKRTLQSKAT